MTENELDELSGLARSGDEAATARVLVHVQPELAQIARREAKGFIDPEDLQSHAVESLLRSWSQQTGPRSNVVGYLTQTMRYRVIDEMRSPRSRTRNMYETEDFMAEDDVASSVEFEQEARWVRSALERLTPDQQRLLKGLYFEGLKPAELAHEFEKSPNAIYSLTRRSKHALRQALLQEALVRNGAEACQQAAENLPDAIADSFEETPANTDGMRHIAGCEHCRAAWRRFGSLTSALGIAGMVALSADALTAAPASAAEPLKETPPTEAGPTNINHSAPLEPSGSVARPELEQTGRWKPALLGAMIGVVVGAAAAVALMHDAGPIATQAPAGSLVLDVHHNEEIDVSIDFEVEGQNGAAGQMSLSHPSSLTLQRMPDGVECTATETLIVCEVESGESFAHSFAFTGSPSLGEDLELTLQATADEYLFTGKMYSEVPKQGSSAMTKADVLAGN